MNTPNINYLWTSLIIEELIRNGVDYFCISPGSRSTPLTYAVADNKKSKSHIHFDERGSAFRALGYSAATCKPSVIITTSGSAVANLFPAVVEASKKKTPLIILTADRPPELRQTGANQTIDQNKIFSDYVRYYVDLPCPTVEIDPAFILTTIDSAVFQSQGLPPGPVHINCMFREQLAPKKQNYNLAHLTKYLAQWKNSNHPYTTHRYGEKVVQSSVINELAEKIKKIKSGIIVVGKLKADKQRKAVLRLAEKLGWPVFPDSTSGLRTKSNHPQVIEHFDQILLDKDFSKKFACDCVFHLGGRITSKRWYEYIEKVNPYYIMIINHPLRNDPLHKVNFRIESHISQPCEALIRKVPQRKILSSTRKLKKISDQVQNYLKSYASKNNEIDEVSLTTLISLHIPTSHHLFVGNSLPIREIDMYAVSSSEPEKTCSLYNMGSNRGASGIDGTVASAVGFSNGLKKPVTALLGDLTFLYDLNSLAMLDSCAQPIIFIVINNNGGGIFSFLPIAQNNKYFERFFATPHDLYFNCAAEMFNLNYSSPDTNEDFIKSYKSATKSRRSTIIEVNTDRQKNVKLQNKLRKSILKILRSYHG